MESLRRPDFLQQHEVTDLYDISNGSREWHDVFHALLCCVRYEEVKMVQQLISLSSWQTQFYAVLPRKGLH